MNPTKKQVLVIDPADSFFAFLDLMLRRLGYATTHAREGVEGLAMARAQRPDLVITEWRLPDLSPKDLFRELIPGQSSESAPVLVISTEMNRKSREEAVAYGAAGFLGKPLSVRALYMAVEDNLERRRRQYIRLPMSLLVCLRDRTSTKQMTLPTESFGEGGMFLRTFNPETVGKLLDLSVHFPSKDQPVSIQGEVVYTILPPSTDRHPGMGIRFLEMDPATKSFLSSFMESKLTEPAPVLFNPPRLATAWA